MKPRDQAPESSAPAGGSIAGIVLAAGSSTRFGRNKLLLRIDGESLARRAATAALDAGLRPVVVVLGHEADLIRAELSGLAVRNVFNPDYGLGMDTSLRAGVAALPDDVVAAVVQLADMPRVTSAMLSRLVERFVDTGAPIVASDYQGVHAPPTLYSRALFPELGGPEGDGSGFARRSRACNGVAAPWP